MKAGEHEPWRSQPPPFAHCRDAQHQRQRQQHQRNHARASRQVPERASVQPEGAHAASFRSCGQPPTVTTSPPAATSRAGRPTSRRRATAPGPSTIAAVLAVFASTHEPAATLTVRHTTAADRPRAGSTMWWQFSPAQRQARVRGTRSGDAAAIDRDRLVDARDLRSVVVGDADRPAAFRRAPGDGDVAAQQTRARRNRRRQQPWRRLGRRQTPSRSHPDRAAYQGRRRLCDVSGQTRSPTVRVPRAQRAVRGATRSPTRSRGRIPAPRRPRRRSGRPGLRWSLPRAVPRPAPQPAAG